MEIQANELSETKIINDKFYDLAKFYNLELVATNNVYYVARDGYELQDIIICIQSGLKVKEKNRKRAISRELYPKSKDEMKRFLGEKFEKAIENANVAKVRTKKANKVAAKRMKNAGRLLAENKQEAFYDEVLKALWGYISDKLNIPVSQLSKDNIEDELTKYGVAPELIKDFIGTLNECEFARYAPGNQNEAMDKVYSSAVEVISKMENSIKH